MRHALPTMEELLGIPPAAEEADGLAPDAEPAADGHDEPLSMVEEAEEEVELASPQEAGGEEPRSSEFSPSSSELWPSDLGGTVTPIAPPPAAKPPVETDGYPPSAEGHAGSLEIYRDPDGQLVKFDSIGRKYPVDARGTRTTRLKPK